LIPEHLKGREGRSSPIRRGKRTKKRGKKSGDPIYPAQKETKKEKRAGTRGSAEQNKEKGGEPPKKTGRGSVYQPQKKKTLSQNGGGGVRAGRRKVQVSRPENGPRKGKARKRHRLCLGCEKKKKQALCCKKEPEAPARPGKEKGRGGGSGKVRKAFRLQATPEIKVPHVNFIRGERRRGRARGEKWLLGKRRLP